MFNPVMHIVSRCRCEPVLPLTQLCTPLPACTCTAASPRRAQQIFVRHCQDVEIIVEQGGRVLTQTIEVDHCTRTAVRVRSRLCTMQVS
jgi:hypothetical protein